MKKLGSWKTKCEGKLSFKQKGIYSQLNRTQQISVDFVIKQGV